jgi:glycosyltransferase involved in cell wall biosynthesis
MSTTVILPSLNDNKCVDVIKPLLENYGYSVIVDETMGLAKAVRRGIERAPDGNIVVMDSDGQHPHSEIPVMIQLLSRYDIVCGCRTNRTNDFQGLLSSVGNIFAKNLLHLPVYDCTSGFFASKREKLLSLPDTIWKGYGDYYVELLMQANRQNWEIGSLSIGYNERIFGESHTNVRVESIRYARRILRCLTI